MARTKQTAKPKATIAKEARKAPAKPPPKWQPDVALARSDAEYTAAEAKVKQRWGEDHPWYSEYVEFVLQHPGRPWEETWGWMAQVPEGYSF
mgnify:CR=1 FL=1